MRATASAAAAIALLALPAAAGAQTVTRGPDLTQTPDGVLECSGTCTLAEVSGPTTLVSSAGTLTGWHVKQRMDLGNPPLALSVKILRPDPATGNYRSVYTGPQQSLLVDGRNDFAESRPVQAGDVIGVQTAAGGGQPAITAPAAADASLGLWQPPLVETDAARSADTQKPGRQLLMNADISVGRPEVEATPPPMPGRSVGAATVSGKVFVTLPGARRRIELTTGAALPNGSTVDARAGRILIVSAANRGGATQSGEFYEGVFEVRQSARDFPVTDLTLSEAVSFRSCAASRNGRGASTSAKRPERHIWGKGKGRFRSNGNNSSATVRGTTWLVSDRCSGTLTRVKEGVVGVRDKTLRRTVTVRTGGSYLARRR